MKTLMYQAYVTDALKCVVLNTSGGNKRVTLEARYIDSVQRNRQPEDERTSEEIIADLQRKAAALNNECI